MTLSRSRVSYTRKLWMGDGMKKERWGGVILVRPDPQVIWPNQEGSWGSYDGYYCREPSGGGHWEYQKRPPENWTIGYDDLTFKIRPTNFKHTGLFPEQAVNWDWVTTRIKAHGGPFRLLNLFGYTGAASIAAAAAGTITRFRRTRPATSRDRMSAITRRLNRSPGSVAAVRSTVSSSSKSPSKN